MMKKIIPIAFILSFCSQPQEASNTVILNYDSKLLSDPTLSLGDSISFQVPVGWSLASAEFEDLIDSTIYENVAMVERIYQDTVSEAFLVCISNPPYQLPKDSVDLKAGKWMALQYSDFEYNNLFLQQTVLQNEQVILFKVNVKKSIAELPISAIHYFIPRNAINSQAMMVESSIASIR